MKTLEYIKSRFEEKGTWASIGIGITGAAALSEPWNILFAIVGVIGTLVPTP